ncbi:MAG TPA: tripartite tricarboxylate transporter TctB family protein [Beijerinckiaceae bacterium]
MSDQTTTESGAHGRVSEDAAGGVFLLLVALFFVWKAWPLPLGSLRAMGPGMLPMSIAVILGAGGLLLAVLSFMGKSQPLAMPHIRGLFFVLGGIVLFGLLIRSFGLVVAGPVSMIFASFATNEVRPVEAVIFAVVMTAFCIALFKYALGLPIPVVAFM